MLRTGLTLGLAAAFWLPGALPCAGQTPGDGGNVLLTPGDWLAEPAESWPAGTVEVEPAPTWQEWVCGAPERFSAWLATPPPPRFVGYGYPLSGTSWRNRPWSVGAFFGPMVGDELIGGRLDQDVGLVGGWRIGYDLDHYWGWETRFAYSSAALDDPQTAPPGRDTHEWLIDGDLLLYPWGDAMWRPYLSLGAGAARVRFDDADGVRYRETLFQIPLGVGIKYFYEPWLALRADLTHNVIVGAAGIDTRDNFSATAGFEWRFGVRPRSYFPW